jgi:hypothetical protein
MLSNLLRSVWRSIRGNASGDVTGSGSGVEAHVRAAIAAFLREPPNHPKHFDFEMVAQFLAAASSAEYMVQRMMQGQNLVHSDALVQFALEQCTVDGLIMEFGVYQGASLRAIAQRVTQVVHGFDSFEGLPEDWTYFQKRGRFSQQGRAPKLEESNVQNTPGLVRQVCAAFFAASFGIRSFCAY